MYNVFIKEMKVQLYDGRKMDLEELVKDYERLLKEKLPKEAITSKLKVGEWFLIDRNVIDKNKEEIRRKCNEAGDEGKKLWKRFEESNRIADENPDEYPRLIETYIFEHNWEYKIEQEMRDMCEDIGAEMCDDVICDFELQMRICNGESVIDLSKMLDELMYSRVIRLRDGGTGYFGGGAGIDFYPPAHIYKNKFDPNNKCYDGTPYAFRPVIS